MTAAGQTCGTCWHWRPHKGNKCALLSLLTGARVTSERTDGADCAGHSDEIIAVDPAIGGDRTVESIVDGAGNLLSCIEITDPAKGTNEKS
jgi:hypothetical protein